MQAATCPSAQPVAQPAAQPSERRGGRRGRGRGGRGGRGRGQKIDVAATVASDNVMAVDEAALGETPKKKRAIASPFNNNAGQWIESVTDLAIRITDWSFFPDCVSSHARLADPIRPMPNKADLGILACRLPLFPNCPIGWRSPANHRLLHQLYPLASNAL